MTRKHLLLLGIVIVVAGCGTPKAATPAPTLEAINIYYPAALQPWADKLSDCAASYPQVALYFIQATSPPASLGPHDILLGMGQPNTNDKDSYLAQVGDEQVVFIINKLNPSSTLTISQIKEIFSGEMLKWDGGTSHLIQVWVLPEGEPPRRIVDEALDLTQLQAPNAKIAPDPQAMLQAVSTDVEAIGYVPQSFLDIKGYNEVDQVKRITLDADLKQELSQSVIASMLSEPSGYGRGLIACLQSSGTH